MLCADPVLQVLLGFCQLMLFKTESCQMRLQGNLTVGEETHQEGLKSLQSSSNADVTGNLSGFSGLLL